MAFRGYGKIKSSCCLHMIYFPIWISHRDVLSIAIMRFIITSINSLRPWPTRRHFADDIFKCIFENENEWISPRIPLKFVPKVRINNIPALVQIKALRRPGDKPLSEPMMVSWLTHICVTRPQWVNGRWNTVMLLYHNTFKYSHISNDHWSIYMFKRQTQSTTYSSNVCLSHTFLHFSSDHVWSYEPVVLAI